MTPPLSAVLGRATTQQKGEATLGVAFKNAVPVYKSKVMLQRGFRGSTLSPMDQHREKLSLKGGK